MTSYSTLRRAAKAKATAAWIDQQIQISDPQEPQFFRLASTPDGLTLHIAVCDDRAAVNRPDGAVGCGFSFTGLGLQASGALPMGPAIACRLGRGRGRLGEL